MDTMTDKDWEEVDRSSREIVSSFLSAVGAVEIGESHGCCCWDLSCVLKGRPTSVEIKDRTFAHNRYGDVMIETVKAEATKEKTQFKTMLAVNVFTDNVIAIANINDKAARHRQLYCPHTSRVKGESRDYHIKECVTLPQRAKVKFFAVDGVLKFKKVN